MSRSTSFLRPESALFSVLIAALVCMGLMTTATITHAQTLDEVGIYWDASFTSNVGNTATIPGVITGYIVLHNPSGTGGVLGWEACIDVEGPGSFAGWDFQGQAINAGTAPCLAVGYTAPLPAGNDIILASFNFVATDVGPITLSMKPDWFASLPGELSYIPGDDPESLVAMYTVTGIEAVAGLNGGNPGVIVERDVVNFGTVALGDSKSEFLNIANNSNTPVQLDLSVTDLCTYFTLPGGTGPLTVPAAGSVDIEILFTPVQTLQVSCTLYLGPNMDPVALTGTGHEPVTSYYFTGYPNLGSVTVGQQSNRWLSVVNNGDTTFEVDINLPASCEDFSLTSGGGYHLMQPGDEVSFNINFAPLSAGEKSCGVNFGNSPVADLIVSGTGVALPESWQAPTNYNFLVHHVGVAASADLTITNTGGTVIPLNATLPFECTEFAIMAGGGGNFSLQPGQSHIVTVQFLANEPGLYQCDLDLGSVVPAIPLQGQAIAAAGAVSVVPSQLAFPSTLVGQISEMDAIITNTVSYDLNLDIQLASQSSDHFAVFAGGGPQVLPSGASITVRVWFAPQADGFQEGFLNLGDGQDPIPLSGSAIVGSPECVIEPPSLNFGTVYLGTNTELTFTITNAGNTPMLIEPTSTVADFTVDDLPTTLSPGQQRTLTVNYHAATIGAATGAILLGDQACGAVTLSAITAVDPAWLTIEPGSVAINPTLVGTAVDRDVLVTNISSTTIDLDVSLPVPSAGFQLAQGAGTGSLYPGDSRLITLRFLSYSSGSFSTVINLGNGLPTVPVTAAAYDPPRECVLSSATVNFGETGVGTTASRYVNITNYSTSDLVLGPLSSSPAFQVSGLPIIVPPGETRALQINFRPSGTTSYSGIITLANGLCADIQCYGQGIPFQNSNTDLLGIYWDPNGWDYWTWSSTNNSVLTGYLMFSNPSTGSGVSAWECKVSTTGPVTILGWQLEGQTINLGTDNEFIVGLAEPLPFHSPNVLLATFEVLYTQIWEDAIFSVSPVRQASIPGYMAWVPDNDPDALLPMFPRGGYFEVAYIGTGAVGVEAPTPTAQLLGGQVDLSWPAPTDANDGCHVYRRIEGEAVVRLTSAPISTTGTNLVFTDLTGNLPAGSKLFYSYAIVRDGEERARSSEVEITLKSLPSITTRLLPNVPNPFNPMTEIRFELGEPQQVSLKIYDVTGRLVRDLESGSLSSGPHSRVWQGRDNSGRQVPSGAYYVRLVTESKIENQKILLLK